MPMSLSGCNGPCSKNADLDDGYGVRLPILNTSGKELTFTVVTSGYSDTKLPTNSQGKTLEGNCYLYGGFSANTASNNYEADLGLIYQKLKDSTEIGWKPYFLFKKGSTELAYTYPDPNYSDVQGKNAYIPDDANGIGVEIYPNYNGLCQIRLRTEGKTMHTNQYGGSQQKWLVNIIQTKNAYVLSHISKYKLLATSTVKSPYTENDISQTYCSGKFTKIAIGGSTPSFGSLETDYGYGTKNATNAYTLGVCKGK